jgi:hypothetical protein
VKIARRGFPHGWNRRFVTLNPVETAVQRQQDDGRCAYWPHQRADERIESQRVSIAVERGGVIGMDLQARERLCPES